MAESEKFTFMEEIRHHGPLESEAVTQSLRTFRLHFPMCVLPPLLLLLAFCERLGYTEEGPAQLKEAKD